MDAALRWLVRRADVGWRQVGAARQLFLPAIHHAAAVHLGLWLLVWHSVLPEFQFQSRYHRRTRDGSQPGSVALGQAGWLPQSCANSSAPPCFIYSPAKYADVVHLTESTFQGGSVSGMPDDIRQPYASSWTVGIQRDLGGQRAIEVRYNGNRTRQQWLAHNINEVNIFENGFLDEFKNAQRNLAINAAAGVTSTSPTAACRGRWTSPSSPRRASRSPTQTPSTTCRTARPAPWPTRWRPTATSPVRCLARQSRRAAPPPARARVIPSTSGGRTNSPLGAASLMDDRGFSNYHGLQVEFRQRNWHGMSLNANYTLSKTDGHRDPGGRLYGRLYRVHKPRPHAQLRACHHRPAACAST